MDIIVCIDKNNGIGKDGGLLFRIPEDMAYFRRMTVNKTVIMGRKTLESLPGGRPLENRRNIVLTRNRDRVPDGADAVSSIDELKRAIGSDKAFVIGGESIYAMLLDYCERAYVTEVEARGNADCFFPDIRSMPNWRLAEQGEEREHGGLKYRFNVYKTTRSKSFKIKPLLSGSISRREALFYDKVYNILEQLRKHSAICGAFV